MKRKIVFYGDSNTYGYDPRGYFGGRYPEDRIWTSLVADALGETWEVINEGENGRRLPDEAGGYRFANMLLRNLTADDLFVIMLGSNDLLITDKPNADVPIRKMEKFLTWIFAGEERPRILILAPPYIGTAEHRDPYFKRFYTESVKMNAGFQKTAKKHNVLFADASGWNIEVTFDEIHFSEAGHQAFAKNLISVLQQKVK